MTDAEAPLSPDALRDAVAGLVRGGWTEFQSSLFLHGGAASVDETKSTLHCHFIASDRSGNPRVVALASQLAKQVVHFCIPRSSILKARALDGDKMVEEITRLSQHAQRLFTTKQPKTGEGGELLLFALLERYLEIPQILSKMSLKTSTEMQIHGTDGVHAKMLDDGALALYWGEAKIYDDLDAAINSCFKSVGPFLRGEADARQDLFLMEHYTDTGDPVLNARLIEFFDNDLPVSADVELRAGCLIGFPTSQYPDLPNKASELQVHIDELYKSWATKLAGRVKSQKLAQFHIELFLLPVPSAGDFRAAIKTSLGIIHD